MEAHLTAWLLADTALAALIAARLNWGSRVQLEALPALRLLVISPGQEYHHGGAVTLTYPRVQIDILGATPESVLAVRAALVARMHQIREGVSGVQGLRGAFIAADRDTDPEDIGGGQMVHRRIVDFFVWHQA